jgi:hypothetical protein
LIRPLPEQKDVRRLLFPIVEGGLCALIPSLGLAIIYLLVMEQISFVAGVGILLAAGFAAVPIADALRELRQPPR